MPTPDYKAIARPSRFLAWTRQLLHTALPGSCALCGGSDAQHGCQRVLRLCAACDMRFFSRNIPRCPVCACAISDTTKGVPCGVCQQTPPAFDASIVACDYAAPADHLIQALKFQARLALAPLFADLLARAVQDQRGMVGQTEADLLTAVPLSAARLAARGFNQASEIARSLSNRLHLPLATQLCIRVRETSAQAGLPLKQRHVNMRGAFIVSPAAPDLSGKHVMVVDDVMTSGRTLHELAACLKRYGASRVTNLVVARTPAV